MRPLVVALHLVEALLVHLGLQACTPVAQDALDPDVALKSCTARPSAILLIESDKRVDAAIPNRAGERRPRLAVVLTVFRYVTVLLDMIGSVWHVLRLSTSYSSSFSSSDSCTRRLGRC